MAVSQEEKRRQILDAAVRAFARKGYHACRVGEIAEEAGTAKPKIGLPLPILHEFDRIGMIGGEAADGGGGTGRGNVGASPASRFEATPVASGFAVSPVETVT